jgi:hypothetical protein
MRSVLVLSMLLGLFVALAIHYSFWAAFGAMQLGGMLAVILIAFMVPNNNT